MTGYPALFSITYVTVPQGLSHMKTKMQNLQRADLHPQLSHPFSPLVPILRVGFPKSPNATTIKDKGGEKQEYE